MSQTLSMAEGFDKLHKVSSDDGKEFTTKSMASRLRNHRIACTGAAFALGPYSATTSPIRTAHTALGPVRYCDLPATLAYPGSFSAMLGHFEMDQDDIESLTSTFEPPGESMATVGSIPIYANHPEIVRDNMGGVSLVPDVNQICGHIRSVATDGANSRVLLRICGDDAINAVACGRYNVLSGGFDWDEEPLDDPDANAALGGRDPEEDPDDDEDWLDLGYCGGRMVMCSPGRSRFAFKLAATEIKTKKVNMRYNHAAFVPKGAISGAKLDQFAKKEEASTMATSETKTPKPPAAAVAGVTSVVDATAAIIAAAKAAETPPATPPAPAAPPAPAPETAQAAAGGGGTAEVNALLAELRAEREALKAERAENAKAALAAAAAQKKSNALTVHYQLCAAGLSCPAAEASDVQILAALDDAGITAFVQSAVARGRVLQMAGTMAEPRILAPEHQNPIANAMANGTIGGVSVGGGALTGAQILAKLPGHYPNQLRERAARGDAKAAETLAAMESAKK